MILIKSDVEIEKMKKSGQILAEGRQILKKLIRPGITTKELDTAFEQFVLSKGAKPSFKGYQGFPSSICVSINDELIHGIPSDRKLKEGDVISIDKGVIWDGYHTDSAFTMGVGKISDNDKKLIKVAEDAFWNAFKVINSNTTIGDITNAVYSVIKNNNFFTPEEFTGHGIGKSLHEEPYIPNCGLSSGEGEKLKDGMVFCIEPMILQGSNKIIISDDNWTVKSLSRLNASHYEHTICIRNGKPEILTGGKFSG